MNYIVMAMGRRAYTYRVIFHEYTHLLVNQNIHRLPLWLNEGLAEFYSTFDGSEDDARLIIGRPIPEHVNLLRGLGALIPMNKFIDPQAMKDLYRDDRLTARFYAQSWLLAHYFLLGDKLAHRPQLASFVNGLQTGEAPDAVFRRVFGSDLDPLDRALGQYVRPDAASSHPRSDTRGEARSGGIEPDGGGRRADPGRPARPDGRIRGGRQTSRQGADAGASARGRAAVTSSKSHRSRSRPGRNRRAECARPARARRLQDRVPAG